MPGRTVGGRGALDRHERRAEGKASQILRKGQRTWASRRKRQNGVRILSKLDNSAVRILGSGHHKAMSLGLTSSHCLNPGNDEKDRRNGWRSKRTRRSNLEKERKRSKSRRSNRIIRTREAASPCLYKAQRPPWDIWNSRAIPRTFNQRKKSIERRGKCHPAGLSCRANYKRCARHEAQSQQIWRNYKVW